MKCSNHQPQFFPWLGYFDKMAKTDVFVLLDEVQLEPASHMVRNRLIAPTGKVGYLTIASNRKGYLEKKYSEIPTASDDSWKQKNLFVLQEYYRKAPFYKQIMEQLEVFYKQDFHTVCEWTISSILLVRKWLEIETRLEYQSNVDYDRSYRRSDLMLGICKGLGADIYFSGKGFSVQYLDREKFIENGVKIVFQNFTHPTYKQLHTSEFIPGLSSLDMFFNCGIEQTREIFWKNVRSVNEFEQLL